MKVCPRCTRTYPDNRNFCTGCGGRLQAKAAPEQSAEGGAGEKSAEPLPDVRPLKERIARARSAKVGAAQAEAPRSAPGPATTQTVPVGQDKQDTTAERIPESVRRRIALSEEDTDRLLTERSRFAWLHLLAQRALMARGPLPEERDWRDARPREDDLSMTVRLYAYPDRPCLEVPSAEGPREFHVLTKQEVILGRQKSMVGIVCRLMPANDETKELSRAIGRRQAGIGLEGDRLWIVDLGSANGTYLDGERLEPNVRIPLIAGSAISLARKLELVLYEERDLAGMLDAMGAGVASAAEEDLRKLFDGLPPEEKDRAPLLSARLSRANNWAGRIEYLLLFQEASIGSHPGCMIPLVGGKGIAPIHAKLLYLDGNLGLLDMGHAGGTRVGSRRIAPFTPTTIPPAAEIAIGGVTLKLRAAVVEG